MKTYTAVFMDRNKNGELETYSVEMQLRKTDALKEAKRIATLNNWRFVELRTN